MTPIVYVHSLAVSGILWFSGMAPRLEAAICSLATATGRKRAMAACRRP